MLLLAAKKVMNQKALSSLEYPKIIERLTEKASSPMGKELCRKLQPSTDINKIRLMQTQTKDALTRLFQKGSVSFGSVKDIRGSLNRLEIGSSLGIMEILSVCALLENTSRVKAYSRGARSDLPSDSLDSMFEQLAPLTPLSSEIRRCILSEDEISDDASPALRQVRRNMKVTNDRIHTQLSGLVNGNARTYLQDSVITMRNGRYCIPVKAEYKGQVPGMIHDQSSTGSTLFIEPMAVVKLNNDMRELELQEQKEIEIILAGLSEQIAEEREAIALNLELMVQLDFIFARAGLAMDMNGSEPVFNEEGRVLLKKARHPLIPKKKVVPIDIRLGDDFDLLIITGPNTGGKTVSLKTVGLLTLMGQAGLHIPALDRSELALFHEIYADIGDEQSIEQSLSTFSSHMTNIVSFLEKADSRSLVLFDELGAGTDPTEGAALAISILSYLHDKGIRTMATTHYSELKVYALSTPGVENACCEFSVETLRPTYRLLIGIPGKSNAFAISSKLGLSDQIIERAKEQISEQDESFEDVLSSLEENRVTIENERLEIARYKEEIKTLKAQLESRQEKLDAQRDRILRQANEEAHKVLEEAKEYADQTMKLFHKFQKNNVDTSAVERERQELRKRMNKAEKNMSDRQETKKPKKQLTAKDIRPGDSVKVLSMNLKGTVGSRPDSKGFLFVQMGIIRSKVHLSDLELVDEPVITIPSLQKTGAGKIRMSKSASVSTEINLLGRTVDEAIAELDKYLDDAYIAHLKSVRIVHGKGTGALRKGIHDYLRRQKHVSSFRLGEFGEGDAGVTIVDFK
jgi:DNA mismatch repair protein MutS2